MAVSTATIDAFPDYTDAQMLKVCRVAEVAVMLNAQSYSINGRSFNRAQLEALAKRTEYYQRRVDSDADSTGGIALVEFRGP